MLQKEASVNTGVAKTEFVKWFSELDKNSGKIAGGKGANLAEIYNLGINVPPGFVITAQAYDYFIKNSLAGTGATKIKEILNSINYENIKQLEEKTEKIREIIEKTEFTKEMQEEIIEAYEALSLGSANAGGMKAEALISSTKPVFVAVRSSATTEDLAEASFAGQQETFLNVKGHHDLLEKIKKCFASLFTSRATYYRNKKGFKHEKTSLAVVIERMINSEKSGVIFSKDPSAGKKNVVIEAVFGLGEGIVSGKITPDEYIVSGNSYENFKILEEKINDKKIEIIKGDGGEEKIAKLSKEKSEKRVLTEKEIKELAYIALKLERHYQKPQDIEFAIENEIYIVQTRPITTLTKIPAPSAGGMKELKGQVIIGGIAASPGIGVGKVKIVHSLSDLEKIQKGDILVTKMTNPDMVVTMQKSAAIVTDEGGLTAHAAIVSREMGIPAVVGTYEATKKLKENEVVTVDGFNGKVYKGKVSESVEKEVKKIDYPENAGGTKIKVIIDLPSFAKRAAQSGIKSVGLARIEGIIAESGKHPLYFLEKGKIKDYEEIIYKGIKQISEYFEEVWVRTSDIRSDEFQNLVGSPKEKEANPMLGMHGIRFSLKYPEILKAELRAMKRVSMSSNAKGTKIGVMIPQVISVQELVKVKKILNEIDFNNAKIGVMIETPAAVQVIEELCKEKINFISFGTNDLTQYTLAVDRGNEQVQELYNESHPAVLRQISHVIKTCKKYGVESSICGQAGSRREMVKFLVENGINSISVNADAAYEISSYIKSIEKNINREEQVNGENNIPSQKKAIRQLTQAEEKRSLVKKELEKQIERAEDLPIIRGIEWLSEDGNQSEELDKDSSNKQTSNEEDEISDIF